MLLRAVPLLLIVATFGCAREEAPSVAPAARATVVSQPGAADVYPADISPPPGTQYPCALTALPKSLTGIPEGDRAYINRTYARVLRATQAKLIVLKALYDDRGIGDAEERHDATIAPLTDLVRDDDAPSGLTDFRSDVVAALELQRTFFRKAAAARRSGDSMEKIYAISEGRDASARLMSAWSKMQARYPSWDQATRDSIYHHLCALDLF